MATHTERATKIVEDIAATLAAIDDPTDRAKTAGALLDAVPQLQRTLRETRQAAVLNLRAGGFSHGAVAAALGISRSRAQQIAEGRTSGSHAKQSAS